MTRQQTAFGLEAIICQRRWQWGEVVLLQSVPVPIRFWSLTVATALIIMFLLITRVALKETVLGHLATRTCLLKGFESQLCVGLRVPPIDGLIEPQTERESLRVHHANTGPFRLEEASFAVETEKAPTVAEPSGGEKTRLIKLMPALREAASGEGLIGGLPRTITSPRYRDQAAAIEQDEQLLFGTISDNICLCSSTPNLSNTLLIAPRIGVSFFVALDDGFVDGLVEMIGIGEGLMGEMMAFQIPPDRFDIIQFRSVFRQPLDRQPVCPCGQGGAGGLARMDRAVGPGTSTTGLPSRPG